MLDYNLGLVGFVDIFPFAGSEVRVVFVSMLVSDGLLRFHSPKIVFHIVNEFLFIDDIWLYHLLESTPYEVL